jgi:peroxiredoxin
MQNAPVVNRLYNTIQEDAALKKDVKLFGLGVGNSPKQLDAFRKAQRVQFPLIADQKGENWSSLGKPGTPTMIIATPSGKVLTSHTGLIKDFDAFLKEIRDLHKKQ